MHFGCIGWSPAALGAPVDGGIDRNKRGHLLASYLAIRASSSALEHRPLTNHTCRNSIENPMKRERARRV
jgi:hypothetical protein